MAALCPSHFPTCVTTVQIAAQAAVTRSALALKPVIDPAH
jgi:hypothetical protein